ncbi:HYR domain-containing protein [Myxococcus sp. K15C18031901]|uniref:HYR domain-containing protein n=1 Tax=Myxococcus dinghuensis TaxID=2906761 RepID=UPI0020A7FEA6|nr:HYR domain-containing protein [Myxococcus dinghuensis]MCP3102986.1 HYR domain-containing protein [Myxococcus dinghuensis]
MTTPKPITLTSALLASFLGAACADTSESAAPPTPPTPLEQTRGALVIGTPYLVKDLLPGELPVDASSFPSFAPEGFVTLGAHTFYAANDGTDDVELWKTDGTLEGTSLVRDVLPGPAPSYPSNLTVLGGQLYFTARTAPSYATQALWRTDGTTEGTSLVASMPGGVTFMTEHGGALYLMTSSGAPSRSFELWRSDGTTAGTSRVVMGGGNTRAEPTFAWVGDTLFFVATDSTNGRELWKSDGTQAGTVMVKDVMPDNADGYDGPFELLSTGTLLYFKTQGIEDYRYLLWRSDGTAQGTFRLLSLQSSPSTSGGVPHVVVDGTLYFAQWDAQTGQELWRSDGTVAGTTRVTDLRPGTQDSLPRNLVAQGTRLWFTADDENRRAQVWVSDGTAQGTRRVTTSSPDTFSTGTVVAATPDGVYFWSSSTVESSLWKTDGTVAGTQKLPIPGNSYSSYRVHPLEGGRLFISSFRGALWRSDGTVEGTASLGRVIRTQNSAMPRQGLNVGGSLVFAVKDGDTFNPLDERLWMSDGTAQGTTRLEDFSSTPGTSFRAIDTTGGQVFIWRQDEGGRDAADHSGTLLRTDGSPRGTRTLQRMKLPKSAYAASQPPPAVALGQELFFGFTGSQANGPSALWKTDGTPEGTRAVATVQDSFFNLNPRLLVNANGRLFFAAGIGLGSEWLWTSDGSGPGTQKVKVFTSNNASAPAIRHMVALGSQVLFWAETQADGYALWTSDGTVAGTRLLTRFEGTSPLATSPLTSAVVDGQVYFVTQASNTPTRLWKTDGGAAVLVASFGVLDSLTLPTRLTAFQGALWFWAFDAAHGYELWTSDGTQAGTVRVTDLNPGAASAVGTPGPLVPVGPDGPLLFAASDGVSGLEPWQTDGTTEGTVRVADLAPGPDSSSPTDLAVAGTHVFFQAWTRGAGAELWAMKRAVQDTEPPVVTCPAAVTVEATQTYGQTVTFPRATATDTRDASPVVRYSHPSGGSFSQGTTSVGVAALDATGNSATCSFDVTVRDTQPPTITCGEPSLRREAWDSRGNHVHIPFGMVTATDVASTPEVTYDPSSGGLFPLGTTSVTATARDGAGHTASCVFDVIVEDTTPPILGECPKGFVSEATGPDGAALSFDWPYTSDAVSTPSLSSTPAQGERVPLGTREVTVTTRDSAGNQKQCTFSVEVRDTLPPDLTCPDTQRLLADTADGKAAATWPDITAEDLVSEATLSFSVEKGTRLTVGTYTVTVTAKDQLDHQRSCTFSLIVQKPGTPLEPEEPSQGRGGGCQAGGAGASSLGAVMLGLWLLRPRRRRAVGVVR